MRGSETCFTSVPAMFYRHCLCSSFQAASVNLRNAIKSRWDRNSTYVCERSSSQCLLLLQQCGHWLEMGWITERLESNRVKLLLQLLSQSGGIYATVNKNNLLFTSAMCKMLVLTLALCLLFQYKATVTPWVGLRKINVSYWCWEDMSPFTNTTLQWLPGEPSDAGFCGYLAEPASSGLKAQSCINPVNGSLCERPGGLEMISSNF